MAGFDKLKYDAETGVFTWAVSGPRIVMGAVAGCIDRHGYRRIKTGGTTFAAHRLAWRLHYGVWPGQQIDHINGIRDDNRICNLRDVSHRGNAQNLRKALSTNRSSGLLGVSWETSANMWRARITANGSALNLGLHRTKESAAAAYREAKRSLHIFQPSA